MGYKTEIIKSLKEFFEFIEWLIKHRRELGEFMSQVQFTATITITPPTAPPLAINPAAGPANFVVGVANSVVLGAITGGVAPYSAAVDTNSANPLPPGLALSVDVNNNLVVSGTATVAGAGDVLIDVADSASAAASAAVKAGLKVT
jgi:hypothetical protein